MDRIRAALRHPGTAVRLVGLSGMGKTRLVQALFDERVGTAALNPALAVYGDVGAELDPSPLYLLRRLARDGQSAVLIVDNCPPTMHAALTKELTSVKSSVSLITVEYDVGDGEHEGTAVFELKSASDAIIQHLISANPFPH